jgi:hypothetical protein
MVKITGFFGLFPSSGILENRKLIQFPKRRVFYSLEYRTMLKVQKKPQFCVIDHRQNPLESLITVIKSELMRRAVYVTRMSAMETSSS